MSLSVAGVGLLSLKSPFSHLYPFIVANTDFQSLFCFIVFLLVIFIIAYLTNPSEASFRAYLTEQSFKLHLSRLDDSAEQSPEDPQHNSSTSALDSCAPFHFANRASVSLRTPKHVFHSLGVFTIAAVVPSSRSNSSDGTNARSAVSQDEMNRLLPTVADSWFIGAFGRWWRGGTLETWYHDLLAPTKEQESWNSGVLAFKSPDKSKDCNGLPICNKAPTQSIAPKLRHRDQKPANGTAIASPLQRRSSSPPPLPKSASLPLHSSRTSHTQPASRSSHTSSVQASVAPPSEPTYGASHTPSKPPSAVFDQSPQIAEVLRQISLTKSSVLDLRNQLSEAQSSASHTHELLEAQVHSCRERKRQEDASRLEMKTRTKALEDSKRQAEGLRKDAEKRLKATRHARDEAQQRITHLDSEITKMRERLADEKAQAEAQKLELEAEERQLEATLESKKREAKVAEDVVAALNLRARELEEKLAAGKERLRLTKEQVELKKQDRTSQAISQAPPQWPKLASQQYHDPSPESSPDHRVVKQSNSPRPTKLSLTGISPFDGFSSNGHANLNSTYRSNKGYAIFDKDLASLQAHIAPTSAHNSTTTFAPFDDEPTSPPLTTPTGSAFIPSSLVSCMEDGLSRSFQSESDMPLEREWRSGQRRPSLDTQNHVLSYSSSTTNTSSPSSLHPPSYSDEVDPFEVRILPHHRQYNDQRWTVDDVDPQRRQQELTSSLYRSNSDPTKHVEPIGYDGSLQDLHKTSTNPRRWFASREKPNNGLNPDAKVFSFNPKHGQDSTNSGINKYSGLAPSMISAPLQHHQLHHLHMNGNGHAYDALNPTGLLSLGHRPPSSHNSSFLRAFAPSPEEREALQRALGGSANTSLERLPSLGSIPSSPTQLHAVPAPIGSDQHRKGLPGWLQSLQLPLKRKTNFSPWDDEPTEPVGSGSTSGRLPVGSR